MALWYHFAILFEVLFILTTVDAGTRVCRFMIQDLVGTAIPAFKRTESWSSNVIGSAAACALWGYFLYQGVLDPLGGIFTLWPLFGVSNQMLAAIALTTCTVILFKMKRQRFAWITIVPTGWLVICTLTAGFEKVFSADIKVGFVSHAIKFSAAAAEGKVLAPAKSVGEMYRVIFNDYVDAVMAAVFASVVMIMVAYGLFRSVRAFRNPRVTTLEVADAGVMAMQAAGDD